MITIKIIYYYSFQKFEEMFDKIMEHVLDMSIRKWLEKREKNIDYGHVMYHVKLHDCVSMCKKSWKIIDMKNHSKRFYVIILWIVYQTWNSLYCQVMFIITFNCENIIIVLSNSFVYKCKGFNKTKLAWFNKTCKCNSK